MVFSSVTFLLAFLPVTLLVCLLMPGARSRNAVLFLLSLVFYAWGEPVYILIMLFSTFFDYGNGRLLERFEKQGKRRAKNAVLILSVTVNLGLLAFFKYTDFLTGSLNGVFSLGIPSLGLRLPVGISFYTFQTLSYTVDVWRGRVKAQQDPVAFGAYVAMFPQLIAGPIVRYADVEKELSERRMSLETVWEGVPRFALGLSKKALIANPLSRYWEEISALSGESTVTALLGVLAFALQLYFDFSGYSDMAIGIGRMLGFHFPENFDHPYEAKSVSEFWRQWHITLGSWFREYLYFPLGGSRKGRARTVRNLLFVWLLTGLRHGAGWNFVLWGLWFFCLIALEKLFLGKLLERLPGIFGHLWTVGTVLLSWVLFQSEDLPAAGRYLLSLFGAHGFMSGVSLFYLRCAGPMLLLAAFFATGIPSRLWKKLAREGARLPFEAAGAFLGLELSLIEVVNSAYNPFLYFRF